MNKELGIRNKGQVLIESIVAISVLVLGLLGIMTLLSRSLRFNNDVTTKFVATYLAAEGMELVKHRADTNVSRGGGVAWNSGLGPGTYEFDYEGTASPTAGAVLRFDPAHGYTYSYGADTRFRRSIIIRDTPGLENGADILRAQVEVRWGAGGSERVTIDDRFYNWRRRR